MICPLLTTTESMILLERVCRKGKCAWWDKDHENCVVVVISKNLAYAAENVYDVVNAINRK